MTPLSTNLAEIVSRLAQTRPKLYQKQPKIKKQKKVKKVDKNKKERSDLEC